MHKTMYCLQREDEKFYWKGATSSQYGWTDDFKRAHLFITEKGAYSRAYTSDGQKCHVCEVMCQLIENEEDYFTVKELTEEIVDKYDGKYYVDYDRPNWIEAVHFKKTKRGLSTHYIGCSSTHTYNHTNIDSFGSKYEDAYSLSYLNMLEENTNLLKEITETEFKRMLKIVKAQKVKYEAFQSEFDNEKKQFECYKFSCCKADVDLFEEK